MKEANMNQDNLNFARLKVLEKEYLKEKEINVELVSALRGIMPYAEDYIYGLAKTYGHIDKLQNAKAAIAKAESK